ncbi:hypothetical protein TSAR_006188 [Trichomalopsis sarcophagae]|uniref:Cilia- and flagella-associated protein 43 n=1 Tax=Trichomalopsis sarcophagae TaxID=543379 RepID=A0A232FE14_9HYME|nr:hypothetical protein TSAR_006188 [Trichomalopsis sarcophagae]
MAIQLENDDAIDATDRIRGWKRLVASIIIYKRLELTKGFLLRWIKTGAVHDFVFVGKDVIATASGNYVIFYNLGTKEERIEYFNDATRGEGACCLAGHPVTPMFSTAERCYSPKIYVHTYPEIRKVALCRLDKGPNSYLSCCFAGTEYLLSLTSFPNFQLIVWLWRTGEKMTSVDTMLTDGIQTIEWSFVDISTFGLSVFSCSGKTLDLRDLHRLTPVRCVTLYGIFSVLLIL